MTASKIVAAAASGVGGAGPDIDEVFNTSLWDGNDGSRTVTNNIDLSGEGGMVWIKRRDGNHGHRLVDTTRGVTKALESYDNTAEATESSGLTNFTSTGFTLSDSAHYNGINQRYVGWTFRKCEKFFDIVQYTGNGSIRNISHNLGSVPGAIFIKKTSGSQNWCVYHRGANNGSSPENRYARLNQTIAFSTDTNMFNSTAPTATSFTVSTDTDNNQSGQTYIAYLFAHHNNNGGFGPSGDKDVIKCGYYTGAASSNVSVDLGFEPQWILIKGPANQNWAMFDVMRGVATGTSTDFYLLADEANAEVAGNRLEINPTGFTINQNHGDVNGNADPYVYIAIRRGPFNVPDDATKVFKTVVPTVNKNDASADIPYWTSGFPVDTAMHRYNSGDNNISHMLANRVTGGSNGVSVEGGASKTGRSMETATDGTEGDSDGYGNALQFDRTNGIHTDVGYGYALNSSEDFTHMWRRAPGYHDVVAYTGTGSNRTVTHNLDAVPEMMWVKPRNATDHWHVYHSAITADKYLTLNNTTAPNDSDTVWNDTTPTSSVFTVGTNGGVNGNGNNYIAYLFATATGVSKVGSFSHTNGSPTNVDCGFSNSARFIITKRTDSTSNWNIFNSERGIVAGNERYYYLNEEDGERSNEDLIDPLSSGFTVTGSYDTGTYIFYAIA
jgi:hypothetical protein